MLLLPRSAIEFTKVKAPSHRLEVNMVTSLHSTHLLFRIARLGPRTRPSARPAVKQNGPGNRTAAPRQLTFCARRLSAPPPASSRTASSASTRAARVIARLPPSLQKYARRLQDAPLSHVAAFLVLHELTAILPLVGLAALFHFYVDASRPVAWMSEHYGSYVEQGLRRFDRYFKRKGWFGFAEQEGDVALEASPGQRPPGQGDAAHEPGLGGNAASALDQTGPEDVSRSWMKGDTKYKIVVEVALSYAIVKALLPLRIVASLWATPWFAGLLGRLRRIGR
jgi:hypothetical protein